MSRILLFTGFLALAISASADDAKNEVKKEMDRLQGTWTVSALTYNGEDSAGKVPNLQFKIEGDVLTVLGNDEVKKEYAKMQITIDPAAKPKLLDFKVTGGTQKDAAIEGIYELKDNELTICAKVLGKDRPTKFESPAGQSVALLVLKREK